MIADFKQQIILLSNYNKEIAQYFIDSIQSFSTPTLIALGGGNSPKKYHQEICNLLKRNQIEIGKNIFFTLTDERHVPLDHDESNSKMILDTFIHPLGLENQFLYPEYYELLEDFGCNFRNKLSKFKGKNTISLLGVGDDGHTASLFPGEKHDNGSSVITVNLAGKSNRISLSQSFLKSFDQRWFFVNSEEKYRAFEKSFEMAGDELPLRNLLLGKDKIFIPQDL
jgi:6-phosphogluconolactonase/glucosamine-6-phosphate isomerase/deaminase